jgi:DNA-binding response OmpR family regulator
VRSYPGRVDPATILVVEDDEPIGRALTRALESQGYRVRWTATGQAGIDAAIDPAPALVLLDLGLPDLDGTEVCRRIRSRDAALPIIILTARHGEVDVVLGLDAGADDYVTKPFHLSELLARVRAHLRRPRRDDGASEQLEIRDVRIARNARRVWLAGNELDLRAKEFDLLAFLMAEAGNALTRERIMSEVWDEHWFGSTKTLDMHVSSLRRKLGESTDDATPSRITTLRGVGYRFEES